MGLYINNKFYITQTLCILYYIITQLNQDIEFLSLDIILIDIAFE